MSKKKYNGVKENNKSYVVMKKEERIAVDDLLSEYEKLSESEQELLNKQAEIQKRKKEIKSMLNGAADDLSGEEKKKIKNGMSSVEPQKGKPKTKRPFNSSQ